VNAPVRPNGVNGFVVAGVDVEHPDHHDQQHDRDLEHHQVGLEPGGPLHAPVQDERDEQAEQHREQVHHVGAGATPVVGLGARRAEHPRRQLDPDEAEQLVEVPGDAPGHHRDDRVYSSSRSQPMNQAANSPSTT
jgi:hypothetical protein